VDPRGRGAVNADVPAAPGGAAGDPRAGRRRLRGGGDEGSADGQSGTTQAQSACADQKLASPTDVTLILDFLPNPVHIAITRDWPPGPTRPTTST
jgi:hypothetical protein